jgi:hypothetical protein
MLPHAHLCSYFRFSLVVIPMVWVRRVTAVIMLGLAAWSAWGALS